MSWLYDYSSLKTVPEQSSAQEKWLTLRDSSRLFYRYYASEAPATLVLLHGSGSESRYLATISTYLSENGLASVITPDLRGHGRTSTTKGDVHYLGQFDQDLEDLLLEVKKQFPNSKLLLGGHSSGGGLALRYSALSTAVPADAYLLYAPYLNHKAPTVKPNSGDWVTVALKRWIGLSKLNNIGIRLFNDKHVLFFNRPEAWNDSLQVDSYSYRLAMSLHPDDYQKAIRQISRPTLVLAGEEDESFYAEKFKEVFSSAPLAQVKIIAQAKHLDILNVPDSYKVVSAWIKKQTR